MSRILVIALVLAAGGIAGADRDTARARYADAEQAYTLGQLDKAIELFHQAYDQLPEPAFLYDIAQAYRQHGDCKQARSFYQRFLTEASADQTRPLTPQIESEVEERITALGTCKTEDAGEEEEDAEPPRAAPEIEQPLVVANAAVGVAKIAAGGLDTPIQLAIAAVVGYPIRLGERVELVLGSGVMFTPLPYTAASGAGQGSLFAVVADGGGVYRVMPELSARVDVGVGAQVIGGLDRPGNPFTVGGAPATGPLAMLVTRFAVSADYALTPDLSITATPLAVSYAPAPAGFMSSIPSLTAVSFLIGVGYRR